MSDDAHLRDDPTLPGGPEHEYDDVPDYRGYTAGWQDPGPVPEPEPATLAGGLLAVIEQLGAVLREHAPALISALTDALAQERTTVRELRALLEQREADVLDLLARIDRDGGPAVRKVLDENRDTFVPLRPSTVARPRYVGESADDYSLRDEL